MTTLYFSLEEEKPIYGKKLRAIPNIIIRLVIKAIRIS